MTAIPAFAQKVFTTATGQFYHLGTCKLVGKASTPTNVYDAQQKGYRPCTKCNPPAKANKPASKLTAKTSASKGKSAQCNVVIKGVRCKNTTGFANGLCKDHGGK